MTTAAPPVVRDLHRHGEVTLREMRGHGWRRVYAHELHGIAVAVLGYRTTDDGGMEFLLQDQVGTCWAGADPVLAAVSGQWAGADSAADAIKILFLQTGYLARLLDLVPLGFSFAAPTTDTVHHLYAVNLTGRKVAGPALGRPRWVDSRQVVGCMDPQVSVMYLRVVAMAPDRTPPPQVEDDDFYATFGTN